MSSNCAWFRLTCLLEAPLYCIVLYCILRYSYYESLAGTIESKLALNLPCLFCLCLLSAADIKIMCYDDWQVGGLFYFIYFFFFLFFWGG